MTSLGKLLKELRNSYNLTQEEVSNKLEISNSYLHKIEMKNEIPSLTLLIKIANTFKWDVSRLCEIAIKDKIKIYEDHINKKWNKEIQQYKENKFGLSNNTVSLENGSSCSLCIKKSIEYMKDELEKTGKHPLKSNMNHCCDCYKQRCEHCKDK